MTVKHTPLTDAFLADHRHLTRGFSALIEALERDDLAEAKRIADELDRLAGPHIEFEELVYYPAVERSLGRDNVDKLYHEHQVGLGAIRSLLERDDTPLIDAERGRLLADANVALEHAVSCGALLGYVTALAEEEQAEMLRHLEAARERGRRWTELSRTR